MILLPTHSAPGAHCFLSHAPDTRSYLSPAPDTRSYLSPAPHTHSYLHPAADTRSYLHIAPDTRIYLSPAPPFMYLDHVLELSHRKMRAQELYESRGGRPGPVSYTHLTLPTSSYV